MEIICTLKINQSLVFVRVEKKLLWSITFPKPSTMNTDVLFQGHIC